MLVKVVTPLSQDQAGDSTVAILEACIRGNTILLHSPDAGPPRRGERDNVRLKIYGAYIHSMIRYMRLQRWYEMHSTILGHCVHHMHDDVTS